LERKRIDRGIGPERAGFWSRGPGDQPVWRSYPARIAFAADPYLARGLR
jgi:hypothetical protein